LGDACQHADVVLYRPLDIAIKAAQRAQIERAAVKPERGVAVFVAWKIGDTADQAQVVDAVA
jgi:hypothetical protein